jgi:WD40 repeat-containing protein SMU1
VASGSFDHTVRVHGLKSGKTLKELRGHTSYVNSVTYTADGQRLVSCSSDGTVRVWDARSCECVTSFKPPQAQSLGEASVHCAMPMPRNAEHLLVCAGKAPRAYITTLRGEVVQSLHPPLTAMF